MITAFLKPPPHPFHGCQESHEVHPSQVSIAGTVFFIRDILNVIDINIAAEEYWRLCIS
jgi:hypothetical protein